jgi:DNA polymerase sigma
MNPPWKTELVLGARVPIVRVLTGGVDIDLSVDNQLPVYKSRLLYEYSLLDKRFAMLVQLVKAWAKARDINSAQHGTFNSYGISLLVLHFLQHVNPPVLPRLNETFRGFPPPRVLAECDGITIRHYTHEDLLQYAWRSDNGASIAMLTHEFFQYFARRFPWDTHAVSVTMPGLVPKSSTAMRKNQSTAIVIQDPFETVEYARTHTRSLLLSLSFSLSLSLSLARAFSLFLSLSLSRSLSLALSLSLSLSLARTHTHALFSRVLWHFAHLLSVFQDDNCARNIKPGRARKLLKEFEHAYTCDFDAFLNAV